MSLLQKAQEVKEAIEKIRASLKGAITDSEKLQICRGNELVKVVCDNDDTMICFVDELELEENFITSLREYVGYDEGVFTLFDMLNIKAESV